MNTHIHPINNNATNKYTAHNAITIYDTMYVCICMCMCMCICICICMCICICNMSALRAAARGAFQLTQARAERGSRHLSVIIAIIIAIVNTNSYYYSYY